MDELIVTLFNPNPMILPIKTIIYFISKFYYFDYSSKTVLKSNF